MRRQVMKRRSEALIVVVLILGAFALTACENLLNRAAPEILIIHGEQELAADGALSVGPYTSGSVTELEFIVKNIGDTTLSFGDDAVVLEDEAGICTVTVQPGGEIVPQDTATFTISVSHGDSGSYSADVGITPEGSEEPILSFSLYLSFVDSPSVQISTGAADPTYTSPIPVAIVFSQPVSGFDMGDLILTNCTASGLTTQDFAHYSVFLDPIADGAVGAEVGAGKATSLLSGAGNLASNGFSIVYDSVNPGITITSPGGATVSTVPIIFSIAVTEPITGFTIEDLNISNGVATALDQTGATTYEATVFPQQDGSVVIAVPAGSATDQAGLGCLQGGPLSITFAGVVVLGSMVIDADAESTGSQNVTLTMTIHPDFDVTLMMISNDIDFLGASWQAFASTHSWSLLQFDGLKTVFVKFKDADGNESGTISDTIVLDSIAPGQPGNAVFDSADDTGRYDDDNVTKQSSSLTLSGADAESGSSVELYSDVGGLLGSATATPLGTWLLDVSLSEATHQITVEVVDAAGNRSAASSPLNLTVDTTAPPPPAPVLAAEDDTGLSSADGVTKLSSGLTFTGAGAEGDSEIEMVSDVDGSLGTAMADGAGLWSIDAALSENNHQISVRQTDLAGNVSSFSTATGITVDLTAPVSKPALLRPYQGERTGVVLDPEFTWTASADGDYYQLQADDGSLFLSPAIDADLLTGTTYTPSADLPVSAVAPVGRRYYVRVRGVDAAGNPGPWSEGPPLRYFDAGRFHNDFNGDGYSDIIAGAVGNDRVTGAGSAFIYFGSAALDSTADVVVSGTAAGDYFGSVVAGVGDVNADGYCDVAVSAPGNDLDGTDYGTVFFFYGGPSMDAIPDVAMHGVSADDHYGRYSLDGADVNGDGYSDLLVCAYGDDTIGADAGAVYLYLGSAVLDNTADLVYYGASAGDQFGYHLDAGDVNNDGYADFVAGARYEDTAADNAGAAYVFFGSQTPDNTADVTLYGTVANERFGLNPAMNGDFDGDGYCDIAVIGGSAGVVSIYFGGQAPDSVVDASVTAVDSGRITSCGDFNGDGFDDLLTTDNNANGYAGEGYVFYGSSTFDTSLDLTIPDTSSEVGFGMSAAMAGDINADGYSDLVVGAYAQFNENGNAHVFLGGASPSDAVYLIIYGEAYEDWLGGSVD